MREIVPADIPAIERLLTQSPEAAQWPPAVFLRGIADGSCAWAAEEGGEVIGMVAARETAGEAEILNLAVLPQHRRRRFGLSLLKFAIAQVRTAGATTVFLEVRESNAAARAFYASMGCEAGGRRRADYRVPGEDALVLSLDINSAENRFKNSCRAAIVVLVFDIM